MAKKRINEADIKEAQNELIKMFVDSLNIKSKKEYKQVVNALNTEEIYGPNKGRLFLELLVRMIPSNNDSIKVNRQKWSEIEKIVDAMDKHLSEFRNKTPAEYKKSYKSYLNRFFKFLRDNKNHNILSELQKGLKMNAAATAAKNALIQGFDGEIYLYSALRTKFKSRLRCQDRTSGDKIWLPLRFIAKLYSIDKKNKKKKNNPFSQWLDSLVNGISVHYDDTNTGKVSHLTFNENLSLVFTNKDKEGYDVFVWQINNGHKDEFRVLTPTGKGNQKTPMKVKSISEIDIDHVKSIDATLREKEQYLTELKKVSDFYKDMVEEEEYDENAKAEELYKKLNLPLLQKELITIGNDGLLRLMDSKYNSQKSNGETFKEIRKIADNKYIGIIEEGIKMDNYPNGNSMTLYQELTDVLSQTGNLSIAYSNSASLNGQDVNQDPNFTLKDIIDKI
ncbi:hypothetical protein [Prevotella sp. P6B1]|uniref:hypothetical protein n=1 Tax=Prevotella sp. P6B1 TaxID=1410613 RepID=UPI00051CA7BD|nr:hypothetical protein [Prevotella sp. P6B1]